SEDAYLISSPDVLVRHAPDIDLAAAAAAGLESFNFQQPKFDQTNYVYIAVNNRGTQPASDSFVSLFWYDPGLPGAFPQDWSDEGLFRAWVSDASTQPGNTLA